MRALGLDPAVLFHRERLTLESADGRFKLRAAALPAPLHLLAAIMTARGLGLREKARLLTITAQLQAGDWQLATGLPVASGRSEEHTSELQSLMRTSYAVFCLKKKTPTRIQTRAA